MTSFCFGVIPSGASHVASAVIATPPPARKVPDLAERTKQMTG